MYSNYEDLIRIRKKTSANTALKIEIAETINELRPQVERINGLPQSDRKAVIMKLKKPYTAARQFAHRNGAASEASPDWAVPAVIESWLFSCMNDSGDELNRVESVMEELSSADRSEETQGGAYIGNLIIFIGTPLVFYFVSWWLGLIVLIIGFVAKGWGQRYNGPFEVK
jgi:hypothetical protein